MITVCIGWLQPNLGLYVALELSKNRWLLAIQFPEFGTPPACVHSGAATPSV